ncbi:hypothetical protein M758_UG011700 [Ceratodon purpureus]|nr:hypothetical protein M758_UG011700 [Ceratodon purpureus]
MYVWFVLDFRVLFLRSIHSVVSGDVYNALNICLVNGDLSIVEIEMCTCRNIAFILILHTDGGIVRSNTTENV